MMTFSPAEPTDPPVDDDRSLRDRGGILPIALVIAITFSLIAISLANYAASSLRFTSTVRERTETQTALESAMRIALEDARWGARDCFTSTTDVLDVTLNGRQVKVTCIRQPSIVGDNGFPAIVITGNETDALRIEEDDMRVLGDVYFANPPTQLNKRLILEEGDVWLGLASCADFNPTPINRLIFDPPGERTYLCDTNNWQTRIPAPSLPAPPPLAPPSIDIPFPAGVGSGPMCRVFFPGTYTAGFNWDKQPDTYFVSGVYHLDNIGTWRIKETRVLAGNPGASLSEDEFERLYVPGCRDAASHPLVNDTGTGATFVFGGNSRLLLEDKSVFEVFAPSVGGYSFVAHSAATNDYAASNTAVNSNEVINQSHDGAALRVHGRTWAPGSKVRLGRQARPEHTIYGEAGESGNLFGGIVVRRLELVKRPPVFGYNILVDTVEPKYNALLIATTGTSTVRVVVDVRPSWGDLAIISWRME